MMDDVYPVILYSAIVIAGFVIINLFEKKVITIRALHGWKILYFWRHGLMLRKLTFPPKEIKYFNRYYWLFVLLLYMPVALWVLTEPNYWQATYISFSFFAARFLAYSMVGWHILRAADKLDKEQKEQDNE